MSTLSRTLRRAALAAFSAAALSACGSLIGPTEAPPQIYILKPQFGPVSNAPATAWQIAVPPPNVPDALDNKRIALQRGQTLDYYADAAWTDQTGDLVQDLLVEALEKSGKVKAVGPTSGGVRADLLVVTELRDFTAHYSSENGAPNVVVDIVAKLITSNHHDVVATFDARREAQAGANSVPAVVQAFNQAVGQAIQDIAGWTLNNATPQASDALPPTTAEPHRRHRPRRHR
jgi:cholesterol transport system auxiliary component